MENQILIVVLDENLRTSDAAYLIEKLRKQDGVKTVRTVERVFADLLEEREEKAER